MRKIVLALALLAIGMLSLAGHVVGAEDPLNLIQCVWEGPNGNCG